VATTPGRTAARCGRGDPADRAHPPAASAATANNEITPSTRRRVVRKRCVMG
jgi:hypothetical protein